MSDPYAWLVSALDTIHQAHWYRAPQTITQSLGPVVEIEGKRWVNFASNDYLGLASHPQMQAAAIAAITAHGTGSTGSRLLSGQRHLHEQLEATLAEFKRTEAALVFSSGYLANLGTIAALVGKRDLILADAYNHSSLKNGAILSGAYYQDYGHGDIDNLHELLSNYRHQYRRCLIVTDSVFSMDGDLCPLPDLLELGEKYNCMVLVDEAHATGVLGTTGAGCVEHFNCSGAPLIQMGTLSKALASLGGYVAGTTRLIDFLRNRAPTWIYTTGLSPADTAAALQALTLVQQEPQRRQQLWDNVTLLKQRLQALPQLQQLDSPYRLLPSESAIVCLQMPDAKTVLAVSQALKDTGFWVPAIRPPTVPTSRLRFSLMASHRAEHIEQVVQVLAGVLVGVGKDWSNRYIEADDNSGSEKIH